MDFFSDFSYSLEHETRSRECESSRHGAVTARKMWYLISLKSLLGTFVCNLWSIVQANCVLVLRF